MARRLGFSALVPVFNWWFYHGEEGPIFCRFVVWIKGTLRCFNSWALCYWRVCHGGGQTAYGVLPKIQDRIGNLSICKVFFWDDIHLCCIKSVRCQKRVSFLDLLFMLVDFVKSSNYLHCHQCFRLLGGSISRSCQYGPTTGSCKNPHPGYQI